MNRHTLSSGVIVVRGDSILLVCENDRWGLPKGGVEFDEPVTATAIREAKEETGLDVAIGSIAFLTEFRKTEWNEHHLQTYFVAEIVGGSLLPNDPDKTVDEARFVPINSLRQYLTFRPRVLPLEQWLKERVPRHHYFDLDLESDDI